MLQNISSFSTNSAVQCKLAHATLRHTRASNARHHTPTYRHALHKYAPLPPPPPCPPPPHHTQRKPREERRRSAMKEGGDEDDEASMDFDFTQAASMVRSQLSTSVGVRVKCAHLESETGRTLNGLEGTIIGVGTPDECAAAVNGGPPFRVNVRVDGKGIRKPSRLPIFFYFFLYVYIYIYIYFFLAPTSPSTTRQRLHQSPHFTRPCILRCVLHLTTAVWKCCVRIQHRVRRQHRGAVTTPRLSRIRRTNMHTACNFGCSLGDGVEDVKKLRMLNLLRPNYRSAGTSHSASFVYVYVWLVDHEVPGPQSRTSHSRSVHSLDVGIRGGGA